MDFTLKIYKQLLAALKDSDYDFQPFAEFIESPGKRVIVLRHDVDAKKMNALHFATLQAKMGILGTYYFRMVSQSFDEKVIREIASFGHEIGYHYETMDTCHGNKDKAHEEFCRNLEVFRKIVPVKTICMHGSPLSKYDNRSLWETYNYKALGLIAEPYLDIDFNKVLYLTDTGRRWDGERVSVRDKVRNAERGTKTEERGTNDILHSTQHSTINIQPSRNPLSGTRYPGFHSTNDIINSAKAGTLPAQLMLTFHPQRWTDKPFPWMKELVWQNMKNIVKRIIVR